jgi:hypothetical protein
MTADRFFEEAYGGRFIPIFTQQEVDSPTVSKSRNRENVSS